tara:strand:+ start:87 stop:590 length:504 start_codon:yes stop_codon:yes gene_type:complete
MRIINNAHFGAAEKMKRAMEAAKGKEITGYEPVKVVSQLRDGQQSYKTEYLPIFAKEPATTPAPAPTPAPTPAPEPVKEEPKGPVEYSPEIQEAKERVNKYESNIKSGDTSEKTFDSNKTYIKESNLDFNKNLDFSSKTYNNANKAASSFLDSKKNQIVGANRTGSV